MNYKSILLSIVLFFLFQASQYAQSFKSINKKANDYFLINQYEKALPLFLWMDSVAPGSGELNYKIALCLLQSSNRLKSLSYLFKSKDLNYNPPGYDFNLGIALHSNERFEEAIGAFEKVKQMKPAPDNRRLKQIDRYIEMCKNGIDFKKNPLEVSISNLGNTINSPCPEYAPVISGNEDKIIFTSKRPCTPSNKVIPNEDLYISERDSTGWLKANPVSSNINTKGHDASVALSADGQKLLVYKDTGNGDLFYSELKGQTWKKPERLPFPINSKSWEPSAAFSPDGNFILVVSDRPGGIGGRDIYRTQRNSEGKWEPLTNLGPHINTEYDEDGPFLHPNGKTLFFSSEGHNSMGGFDIFSSELLDDSMKWGAPKNLGYPISTVNDDIFFVWSADGKRAYFSSDRPGGSGDKDIYMVETKQKEMSLILLKGIITSDLSNVPVEAKITIVDNETNKIVGIYNSNSSNGKYSAFLLPGKNYGISIENDGFLPYSENIHINDSVYQELIRDFRLKEINEGKSVVLRNVFFDFGKSSLKKESFPELNKISLFLKDNPLLIIEIGGHTDDIGEDEENLKLSEKRALAVLNYFVSKGISINRLKAVGYGEKKPIQPNDTEEGKRVNRRTELIIINK